jgi:hypothetical protein
MPADNPAVTPPLRLLERPAFLIRRPQAPAEPLPRWWLRWLRSLMAIPLRRR